MKECHTFQQDGQDFTQNTLGKWERNRYELRKLPGKAAMSRIFSDSALHMDKFSPAKLFVTQTHGMRN